MRQAEGPDRLLTVVVEQLLAPIPGGTGRYAAEIAKALAASVPEGWRVRTVTAWHRDLAAARLDGVTGPGRLPLGRRALAEAWSWGLPPWVGGDAVHCTTPLAPPRLSNAVVTVHDAVPWTDPETLTPRGVQWHRRTVGRAMRSAKAVVVPSSAVADDLAGIFPAEQEKVHVIGHGVTTLAPPADATARRIRLGLPDRYLLSVATVEPRKGLDVLLDALTRPAAHGLPLVIAGPPGWGGLDVGQVAARVGLSPERVHLLGRVGDDDLAVALGGALALVAPSRSEGFGLPVLEAFAAGVPVVASDAPALVELAAGAAVIAPRQDAAALADAIGRVTADPAHREELARRGVARAAQFTWRRAAEALWRLHAAPAGLRPVDVARG